MITIMPTLICRLFTCVVVSINRQNRLLVIFSDDLMEKNLRKDLMMKFFIILGLITLLISMIYIHRGSLV